MLREKGLCDVNGSSTDITPTHMHIKTQTHTYVTATSPNVLNTQTENGPII